MFRKNKKGIEISVNFVVILILALFIFGLSVWFLQRVFTQTLDVYTQTSDDLDKQIGFINCGNRVACLNTDRLEIERGKYKVFGLKLVNSRPEANIKVKVSTSYADVNDQSQKDSFGVWLGSQDQYERIIEIKPGEEKPIGIAVIVSKETVSDKYVFDVETSYCDASDPVSECARSYDFNNEKIFDDGLYLLYVTIP